MDLKTLCLKDVDEARVRLSPIIKKTPLVQLQHSLPKGTVIHLKLENLQPIGSFKLRGAYNAVSSLTKDQLQNGVYTASAGNFSQGLAWCTSRLGLSCEVIVPDNAPRAKLDPTRSLGATVTTVTHDEWWKVITDHKFEGACGTFVHPVCNREVIAGNGTIGLEILEDLPEVDSIIVPYGGGGLSSGIALAVKTLRPQVKVFASEVETSAPLRAALAAGRPVDCPRTPSFVDGIGSRRVLDEMWPLVSMLLDGSIVVSLEEVVDAVRQLAEKNHVISEGAGASSVAAALTGKAGSGNVVCIVSGGNIDSHILAKILQGSMP